MLRNLKILRRECQISQQKLADAIDVSQQSINQYENHNIEPDIAVLSRLADFFDTSIDYVVGRTDIRRRIEETEPFHLNKKEAEIVLEYRALKDNEKECIDMMLRTLARK